MQGPASDANLPSDALTGKPAQRSKTSQAVQIGSHEENRVPSSMRADRATFTDGGRATQLLYTPGAMCGDRSQMRIYAAQRATAI